MRVSGCGLASADGLECSACKRWRVAQLCIPSVTTTITATTTSTSAAAVAAGGCLTQHTPEVGSCALKRQHRVFPHGGWAKRKHASRQATAQPLYRLNHFARAVSGEHAAAIRSGSNEGEHLHPTCYWHIYAASQPQPSSEHALHAVRHYSTAPPPQQRLAHLTAAATSLSSGRAASVNHRSCSAWPCPPSAPFPSGCSCSGPTGSEAPPTPPPAPSAPEAPANLLREAPAPPASSKPASSQKSMDAPPPCKLVSSPAPPLAAVVNIPLPDCAHHEQRKQSHVNWQVRHTLVRAKASTSLSMHSKRTHPASIAPLQAGLPSAD